MDAIEALGALAADPEIGDRLTRLEVVAARPARFGETEKPLHPEVLERLAARGAERLYVHQAEAVDLLGAACRGRHQPGPPGVPGNAGVLLAAGGPGRAGPSAVGRHPWWPATTSSTVGTSTTPPSCSPGRWSRRW